MWPWQRRFLRGAFAEGVTTAGLTIARGNGKTTLAAAIAAAGIAGPLRRPRGLVLVVGASFQRRSRILFRHVLAMLADELADRETWRVNDSTASLSIEHRPTGARLECIGSDPRRAHGFAPSLAILDEPSQWAPNASDRMYSAIKTGARQASRLTDSVRSARHPQPNQAKPGGAACYRAPVPAAPPTFKSMRPDAMNRPGRWQAMGRANPSMKHLPELEAALKSERSEARQDSGLEPAYRSLRS